MSTCTIYYPGLLGPDVPIAELASDEWPDPKQTSHLCKLLSYGKSQASVKISIDARILECLGISISPESELPVSQIRAIHHDIDAASLWCLDPVHIQIDRDEALLLANESLMLSEQHARQLINDLNQHFEQDGLQIHYHNEHQWLLSGVLSVNTNSLNDVLLQNISDYQPTGKDEKKWRTLINEVQMLLHLHPVNAQRERLGLLTVNSLWVWGGGELNNSDSAIDLVFADNTLVKDAAKVIGVDQKALPEHFEPNHFTNKNVLLVLMGQMDAIRQKDMFSWFEHLKQLDHDVLSPLLTLMQQGDIETLVVKSDTVAIELRKKDLPGKFLSLFRKPVPLEKQIMQLRTQYGC